MKALFVGLNWLGDAIISFPAIVNTAINLKEKVDVITRPNIADIYKFNPAISNIFSINTKKHIFSYFSKLLKIRKKNYDFVFVLPMSFRSAIIGFIIGGKIRIGYSAQFRSLFLTHPVPLPDNYLCIHESKLYRNLITHAKLIDYEAPLPTINVSLDLYRKVQNRLGVDFSVPYVVISPGAEYGLAKMLPVDKYREVANILFSRTGCKIIATGTYKERQLTREVVRDLGNNGIDLGGKTTIEELVAIVSKAKVVISNDSGTMHVAALTKTPSVVPIGSTDVIRTGALSDRVVYVSSQACNLKCRKKLCPKDTYECLRSISSRMIVDSAVEIISRQNFVSHG